MECKDWMGNKVVAVLDKYHTTATIPLNELVSKILDELATPDLYEALKLIASREDVRTYHASILEIAEQALAKAEGK